MGVPSGALGICAISMVLRYYRGLGCRVQAGFIVLTKNDRGAFSRKSHIS